MYVKESIPFFIFISVFILGFMYTSYIFKDEIRGMLFDGTIEYGTTEGLITTSSTKIRGARHSSSEIVDIRYTYEVESIPYSSTLVTLAADYHEIDYYLNKYPLNRKVTVYYDVNDPSFAVLEPDKKDWTVLLRPFAWIFFGGLIFLVMYLSTKISWLKELMEWISKSTR